MDGIKILLAGCLFYPALYVCCRKILQHLFGSILTLCDQYLISEKCVNAVQGVLATVVGAIIATSCHGNIMEDRHWLTNGFAWFGFPYFAFDLWAIYNTHFYLHQEKLESYSQGRRLWHCVQNNKLMVVHHIVLPLILFPAILYFRADKGDYFVGVFYTIEVVLPFIAIRFILVQLKLKDTSTYICFGIVMIVMFFITRILVFPFLYWKYGQYAATPLTSVPFNIPVKCNFGCLAILVIQVRILYLMMRGAFKLFCKAGKHKKPD